MRTTEQAREAAARRPAHWRGTLALASSVALTLVLAACRQEERSLRDASPRQTQVISQSELYPGASPPRLHPGSPYAGSAHATGEGRRLYHWFNCSGCHFNGGGGIGPPLMDEAWIYGSEPANIFASILEGRPDGMPAFRGRITDQQAWQLVEYVRSLSGLPESGKPPDRKHLPQRSTSASPGDDAHAESSGGP